MGKREKALEKMRHNPKGWRIEDLKGMADHFGILYRQYRTSHVTFVIPGHRAWPIPTHGEIEPIYVIGFLKLLDEAGHGKD